MKLRILTASMMMILAVPALGGPSFRILVDGKALTQAEMNRVRSAEVVQDISRPDRCELKLQRTPGRAAGPELDIGSELEVQAGQDGMEMIFHGEVVGIEPVFVAGEESKVVVVGFDKSHRLSRGRRSRTWTGISDPELVSTIAAEYGLAAEVEDPGIRYQFVYQNNQTDLEFLRQRAARIGYQLEAVGNLLHFRSLVSRSRTVETVEQFRPAKLTDRDVPGPLRVIVRGWDPAKKEEIVGEAEADTGEEGPGVTHLFDWADELAEEPRNSQFLVFSLQELELVTQAQLRLQVGRSRSVRGQAKGDPSLRAGQMIGLSGLGGRFDGSYFVERVTHQLSKGGGYTTNLRLSRHAEGN